jgi:hypothetical protein
VLPELDDRMAPSLVITAGADVVVTVFGAAPGSAAVDDLIARLGVRPSSDDRHHGTHLETKRWLSAGDDTPDPRWAYLHSEYFPDPALATEEPYYLGNTARRARIRAPHDPEGVFALN